VHDSGSLLVLPGVDSMKCVNTINKLNTIAKFIYMDKFWKAQIEQVFVDDNMDLELIPKVGRQVILFGDIDRMAEKFKFLKAFYKDKMSQVGWNKYIVINLKFRNQIVCTKI